MKECLGSNDGSRGALAKKLNLSNTRELNQLLQK
jgi:hypothetical protein